MHEPDLRNWIDGAWRATDFEFELASRAAGDRPKVRVSRAGSRELGDALSAGARSFTLWRSKSRRERIARLFAVADALNSDASLAASFVDAFDLDPDEARSLAESELFRMRESLELLADAGDASASSGVFLAHWSDRVGPLAARVFARLADGSTATLVADKHFARAAHALARAAAEAELGGALNVLFDDTLATIEAALGDERATWARLAGSDPLLERLESRVRPETDLTSWPVRSASLVLDLNDDPALAAARTIETSLARSATLSGQLPGRTGRVLCPGRVFSRYCEELLLAFDRSSDVARPVPLIESDAQEALAEAWFLGLDEGATPLAGGEPWIRTSEGDGGGGPGTGRRGERSGARAEPVVFTNVEPDMRLSRFRRAVPVLALMRVESREAGLELAAQLDDAQ